MQHTPLIILDDLLDWQPYHPSQSTISAGDYITDQDLKRRAPIINLCDDLSYLSNGYYVSLLAEARGQRVLPSVSTINDLMNVAQYQVFFRDLNKQLKKYVKESDTDSKEVRLLICFGQCQNDNLSQLARQLFEAYPCPILEAEFRLEGRWFINSLRNRPLSDLNDQEQDLFAHGLEKFSKSVWRKAKARQEYKYDLAILYDPNEFVPTSDKKALQKFVRIAKDFNIEAELITQEDYGRLLEFDGLFIRENTKINHYTYHFAKKAEANGMVVIDHPDAILRCANKVFLNELLEKHKIPRPKTEIVVKSEHLDVEGIASRFGFPLVLKIPDGSFSVGVEKVRNEEELHSISEELFRKSSILLIQEWLPTDFDWRIGVLNNRAVYACQYFMARNHWQIYNHAEQGKNKSGSFTCIGVHQVPKDVIKIALQATRLIGDGLYGVDIKETPKGPVIIEINDNPSIESGVEDLYLGDELYRIVMSDFLRRMED
ncbi:MULTISPECIES: RimK family protein [Gammaproteobacteria]|uniref:RimK family protein n=1 Tax=Gammaproteobacteria TaxID=1236 RepID=UPI000DCFD36C|nr:MULTISPECIES: RimK family protein [Gammaproteobacteria]RTE85574.1 ATP-grasp domain-containing protein [Aliidiomarina sp. B3213]TCZ89544.1 ATP-grasp domain-containing protein [Lysobacter sp. N42]